MIEPDTPRRYGLTALQTLGILVACMTLLYVLSALLPGP